MSNRFVKFVMFFGVIGGGATAILLFHVKTWGENTISLKEPVEIDFPRGTPLTKLSAILKEKQLIDNDLYFKIWIKCFSDYSKFQAGLYRFEQGISPAGIVTTIQNGKVYVPVAFKYTIPEGYNIRQITDKLVQADIGTKQKFEKLFTNKAFIKTLGVDAPLLEGYLYPATYSFTNMPTPEEVISKAIMTFWEKLPKDYEEEAKKMGLSLNQAITFASLIELETLHDEERAFISEVIWKRLKDKSPLGIDSALIYGLKDYQGDITWKHLRDSNNLYNTRLRPGLPPTPIASVSVASLKAVLNPSKKGYYYFVRKAGDDDRHHFSKTLNEHNVYVKKLVEATKIGR